MGLELTRDANSAVQSPLVSSTRGTGCAVPWLLLLGSLYSQHIKVPCPVSWNYLRFLNFVSNSDSNCSFLTPVSTAYVKNMGIWNMLYVTGGNKNLKMDSKGMSHLGKHREQCWFALSYCWNVLCFPKEMTWCVWGDEWGTALHCLRCSLQKDISSFQCCWRNPEANKAASERHTRSERKNYEAKVTELCQDCCHLNLKQQHCQ